MTLLRAVAVMLLLIASGTMTVRAAEPPGRCTSATVTLRTLPWTEASELIATHRDQVVLVDVWTTTCPTCLEHFPEFVQLHQRLQGRGLVCISVNCDHDGIPAKPPAYYAPRVLKFLEDHDARLVNLLLTDPLLDFQDAANIEATPTYLLYDRSGQLLHRFDGSTEEFTFDQVAQAVESAMSRCANGDRSTDEN